MKKLTIIILLAIATIFSVDSLHGQNTDVLHFRVNYELDFVNIELGSVLFEITDTTFDDNTQQLMHCYASTHSNFDWLYCVRDTFECAIDENKRPLYYRSHSVEGSANDYSFYRYTRDSVFINVNNKGEEPIIDTLKIDCNTYDMLSTANSFRYIEAQHEGDTIYRKVVFNGRLSTLPIVFHGCEQHKVLGTTNHYSLKLESGSIFVDGRSIHIYTNMEKPATPILIEADIPIGTISIRLNKD